jgi:uncharacterized membrane protein YfcA
MISSEVLKPFILVLIVLIGIYTFKKKDFGHEERETPASRHLGWSAMAIGGLLGFYNGMIGPGTGSLLVFGFVRVIGYSFLRASAVSKVVNVIADVSSLVYFILNKHILYQLALPMMVCNVAGSYAGSRMAVLRGNAFVRKVFLVVVAGIVLRFAWDILKPIFAV